MLTVKRSDSGKTLLESIIDLGENPDRQCLSGYCGCCRMKLKEGQVQYVTNPLAWLHQDEILPCICKVATGTVVVSAVF